MKRYKRSVKSLGYPRPKPSLESLEDRCVPALFIENFSDDIDRTQLGWDSWDGDPNTNVPDELRIVTDLPVYPGQSAPPLNGPFPPAEYYVVNVFPILQNNDPSAPVLALLASETGDGAVTFRPAPVGTPGGLAAGDQILAASVTVWGFGRIEFIGMNNRTLVVDTQQLFYDSFPAYSPYAPHTFTGTYNSVLESGGELGPIREVKFFAYVRPPIFHDYPDLALDNVTFLVAGNAAPPVEDDQVLAAAGEVTLIDPTANDRDTDGDGNPDTPPLEIVRFTQPSHGTVESFDGSPLFLVYRPEAGFTGDDEFTYTVREAGLFAESTATVRLRVNHRPSGTPDTYLFHHGRTEPIDRNRFEGVLANDAPDPDGEPLTLAVADLPRYGSVSLDANDGSFTYTPTTTDGRVYNDSFTYTLTDGNFVTDPILVTLRVDFNRQPEATGGLIVAAHNAPTPLFGSYSAVDSDGDPLTALFVDEPRHGIATLSVVNGRVEVQYQTVLGVARGPDHFTYRLFDGYDYSAPATVEIRVPNNAPVAHPDFYFRGIGADGDPRETILMGGRRIEGNLFQGRRYGNIDDGSDFILDRFYEVSPSSEPYVDLGADRDADGDPLQLVTIIEGPRYGTLLEWHANGDFVYLLPPEFPILDPETGEPTGSYQLAGSDVLRYRISDGHSFSEAVVTFSVVNDIPPHALQFEVAGGHPLSIPERFGPLSTEGLASWRNLQLVEPPRHEDRTFVVDGFTLNADGSFIYRPAPEFVGVDGFMVSVEDRILVYEQGLPVENVVRYLRPVTITVRNDLPEASGDRYLAGNNQLLVIPAALGVLANDSDPNFQTLRLVSFAPPAHGRIVSYSEDGAFIYEPEPGFLGVVSFTYQVSDSASDVASATVTIEVIDGGVAHLIASGGHHVVLVSSPGTTLENARVTLPPPGAPVALPLGYFSFEVHGVPAGGFAEVRFIVPPDAPAVNEYWKYGTIMGQPPEGWYRFLPAGVVGPEFRPGEIVLHFQDGNVGDATGPDGVIVDPGGPAFSRTSLVEPFAVGAGSGAGPIVRFSNPDGSERSRLMAFDPEFRGGVRTATADFSGDGVEDVVVGTGPGVAARVRVFDGVTQSVLFDIEPFESSFLGGVFVAAGNLTGDGRAELVITPDRGGGPRVRVFGYDGFQTRQIADFFGILGDPTFRGGARAAMGDVNGDGVDDVIVAAGHGGGPRVAVFDGRKLSDGGTLSGQAEARWESWKLFGDFSVFDPTLRNGIFIAAGDLTGDGFADVIAGGGTGDGPRVFALNGKELLENRTTPVANFFAGDETNRRGIRVAVKHLDGDVRSDLIVGVGSGSGSRVIAYPGIAIPPNGLPPAFFDFEAFPGEMMGVFIG